MKAMIFAAGLGTRLRPLTADRPKALVEINGRTLLEITLSHLRSFGVTEVIINVHHFADMIVRYLQTNDNFGMRIEVSREETLLDTGGGLKKAAHFFVEKSVNDSVAASSYAEEPFIIHNVDVLSTIDLRRMVQFHRENHALATLAVRDRQTSRYLLFDDQLRLCGRRSDEDISGDSAGKCAGEVSGDSSGNNQPARVGNFQPAHALAFSGIHIVSPRLLSMLTEDGAFSIITSYLRLAAHGNGEGEKILAFRTDEYYWRDLGSPQNVAQAAQDIVDKLVAL